MLRIPTRLFCLLYAVSFNSEECSFEAERYCVFVYLVEVQSFQYSAKHRARAALIKFCFSSLREQCYFDLPR